MANEFLLQVRIPMALKKQVQQEAKGYGVSMAELVRKRLTAVPLRKSPVVRILAGRLPGAKLLRVEIPLVEGKRRGSVRKRARGKVADG